MCTQSSTTTTTMVGCNISADCKLATIRLHENGLLPLAMILDCCKFSRKTWFRVIKLWRKTGHVIRHGEIRHGCLCILDTDDIQYLLQLVRNNPDYFLNEMPNLLQTSRFISVHYTTIFCELKCCGMSRNILRSSVMKKSMQPLSKGWLSICLKSLDFWMKYLRMLVQPGGPLDGQRKASVWKRNKLSLEGGELPQKLFSHWMGLLLGQLSKGQWQRRHFYITLNSLW